MSRLQLIQVIAQQMAEAISSVLGMDVTVVDENMARIAGTGYHRNTIGQKIIGNSVYHQVMQTAESYIITDISEHSACYLCEKRATCLELAQLCCPILLGSETVGIVGLIAFSREQQVEIVAKGEQLLTFIRKMAELITAKIVEKDAMQRLVFLKNQVETILNFVTEGIVAIDHMERIINLNYAAEKMLRVKADDVIGFHLNEIFPGTPIGGILRSRTGFIDKEVSLWHNGRHHHYFINAKPMLADGVVKGVVASFRPAGHQSGLATTTLLRVTFADVVGSSARIEAVKSEARKAAGGVSTVLITGESGTGKEVFARAIHSESERGAKPFVAINCAAIPETLLESELFGFEEGAFTGAKKGGKPGKFQIADGGTLFLDEIGDMSLALQAKLLRVLQDKSIERVGGIRSLPVDVRIIAATNRELEELVKTGRFREDLYYRLNVFLLALPALRERAEDIMDLAGYFLHRHARSYGKEAAGFSSEAAVALKNYDWPGNIRELENAVECAVIRMANPTIELNDLPAKIATGMNAAVAAVYPAEKEMIASALAVFGTTVEGKKQAAASLGMSIATLYRKINKYNLS